jgi:hypothetical protein
MVVGAATSLFALTLLLSSAGCGGPCVENREGAPLTLTTVTNAKTGDTLDTVMISNIVVDGNPQSSFPGGEPVDSGMDEDVYRCDLPCAITNRVGEAEFTVEADGFEQKRVTRESDYQDSRGSGCPITLTDGRRTTVELEPAASGT